MIRKRSLLFLLLIAICIFLVYSADTYRNRVAVFGLSLDIWGGWFISRKLVKNDFENRALAIAVNFDYYWHKFTLLDKLFFRIYRDLYLISNCFEKSQESQEEKKRQELRKIIGDHEGLVGFMLLFLGFFIQAISYLL